MDERFDGVRDVGTRNVTGEVTKISDPARDSVIQAFGFYALPSHCDLAGADSDASPEDIGLLAKLAQSRANTAAEVNHV